MEKSELRKKMSNWDFSQHTHTIEEFKSEKGNTIRIDHLRKGNSNAGYVRFVNDDYGLSVYGDFGNWIFCRPFVPSEEDYVCVHYWNEKLKIGSSQDHAQYDSEETEKEIKRLMSELEEEKEEYEDKRYNQLMEWYDSLLNCVSDELDYLYNAHRERPSFIDTENIPYEKKGSNQLLIVFDAFNEICRIIENEKNNE